MDVKCSEKKIYKINKLAGKKNGDLIRIGNQILGKYKYNSQVLCPESLNTEGINEGIEIGIDSVLFSSEMPIEDPLNFKQVKPVNKDYYSIDFRSNNFGRYNIENDNFVFVKLMEILPKRYYNKDVLFEEHEKGKEIKVKGILSTKNPDYLFLIRCTGNEPRGYISKYSLINAHLIPVKPLKSMVIDYLNQIRYFNDLLPLEFGYGDIEILLDYYQTWHLYRKEKKIREYDFEMFRAKDSHRPDLFMKIKKDRLLNYIKFDENGLIKEKNP